MKTLFSNQIFGANFAPRRLSSAFSDLLQQFGISEADIEELITKLPSESVGSYRTRLDECKAKGVASGEGVACLYRLYQDLKAGSKAPVPVPTVPQTTTAFPVVPVVIGAVILAGVGIYFAVKK